MQAVAAQATNVMEQTVEKMLGAKVPEDVYRNFKMEAVKRGESMSEAILNAALLYINSLEKGELIK